MTLRNASGGFDAPIRGGGPVRYDSWTIADPNVDGLPDIVANGWQLSDSNIGIGVSFGDGSGKFSVPALTLRSRPQNGTDRPAIADFDQDGYPDIAAVGYVGHVDYWRNLGGTDFAPSVVSDYGLGRAINARLWGADLNEDAYPDLLVQRPDGFEIQLNELAPPPQPPPDPDPDPDVPPVVSGGKLELRLGDLPRRLSAKRLARGLELDGDSSPASQVHAELSVGAAVARRLGLASTLLASGDAIWDGDGTLTLRTGGAGRAALKAYRGRGFEVRVTVGAEYLDAGTGEPVRAEPRGGTVSVRARHKRG